MPCTRVAVRGITLIEVLISIFVLGIGLLGVLSLFTAGRDVESRAVRKSAAMSYADTIASNLVSDWSLLRNWRWTDTGGGAAADWWGSADGRIAKIDLPVVIDPYALNRDSALDASLGLTPAGWWWHRFVLLPDRDLGDGTWATPFRRTSIFNTTTPVARTAMLATVSDPDAVEYRLNRQDQTAAPENVFEFGRRSRAGDLTPALFVAQHPCTEPASNLKPIAAETNIPVVRWLLVFHKLPVDQMAQAQAGPAWPSGFLAFHVNEANEELLALSVPAHRDRSPPMSLLRDDDTSLRRSLKPGQWMLFVRNPKVTANDAWMVHWARLVSAAEDGEYLEPPAPGIKRKRWLITIDPPLPNAHFTHDWSDVPDDSYQAFAFESLLHVKPLDLTGATFLTF